MSFSSSRNSRNPGYSPLQAQNTSDSPKVLCGQAVFPSGFMLALASGPLVFFLLGYGIRGWASEA